MAFIIGMYCEEWSGVTANINILGLILGLSLTMRLTSIARDTCQVGFFWFNHLQDSAMEIAAENVEPCAGILFVPYNKK